MLVVSAYVFFPREVNKSNIEKVHCNINGVNRYLMNPNKWAHWWPGTVTQDSVSGKYSFKYKGFTYTIAEKRYNSLVLQTSADNLTMEGILLFFPLTADSVQVEWKYALRTTANLLYRVNLYWQTRKLNDNMIGILDSMKSFMDNQDKVYGMHIEQVFVKDTILLTTNFKSNQYPETEIIYGHINDIKNYISTHGAKQTNVPMLHVVVDSGIFKTQVAIPINKVIEGNAMFPVKRMVPGKILVAEVKGGVYTANHALQEMSMFMSDNHYSSPAIPFESLVTNRMQEPDTLKWITKIYYPIF